MGVILESRERERERDKAKQKYGESKHKEWEKDIKTTLKVIGKV